MSSSSSSSGQQQIIRKPGKGGSKQPLRSGASPLAGPSSSSSSSSSSSEIAPDEHIYHQLYSRIIDYDSQDKLAALPFKPRICAQYLAQRNLENLKMIRICIIKSTMDACNTFRYKLPDGSTVFYCKTKLAAAAAANPPAPNLAITPNQLSLDGLTEEEYVARAEEIVAEQARATAFFELKVPREITSLLQSGVSRLPEDADHPAAEDSSSDVDFIKNISEQVASFSVSESDSEDSSSSAALAAKGKARSVPYYERNTRDSLYWRDIGIVSAVPPGPVPLRDESCAFFVYRGDCLEVGLQLKKECGLNPVVLNMASHKRPGGGYASGAGAQEENLFRRTNYLETLGNASYHDKNRKWKYPLPEFGGVYNPEVFVFRGTEQDGYPYLPQAETMSFIAVAAYARPELLDYTKKVKGKPHASSAPEGVPENRREPRLAPKFVDKTRHKMRGLLAVCAAKGHDAVVLSAMGCGAFGNPPGHIAKIFNEVIHHPADSFSRRFKVICFAIFDDKNAHLSHNPRGNVAPFEDVFGQALSARDIPEFVKSGAKTKAGSLAGQ